MLQSIRDRATGWIAWVIVIFITIPFALWGVQEYAGVGGPVVAASVNGAEIPLQSLQRQVQNERSRLQDMLGDAASQFVSDEALRKQVLQRMIDAELRRQSAYSAGFRVGDTRVAKEIDSIDAFKRDGRFDPQLYERVLMRNDFSPTRFEEQLRSDLLTNQLVEGVASSAIVTAAEFDGYYRLREQRRSFRYLMVDKALQGVAEAVTDEEVAKEYEANQSLFMEPEQTKVEYLELKLDQVMGAVTVDDAAVEAFYEERKARYRREEQRRASHILLALEDGADQAREDQARAEAMSLFERIRDGEDFAALAKEYSQDPGSAAQGGNLGFFGKGTMVGPFEDAVFGMAAGDVSEPVRSPFGYHIIRLDEIKPGETKSFTEVRDEVEREYRRRQAEGMFVEQLEQLSTLSYENPTTLSVAAEALGLAVQSSDWFSRDHGEGVASEAKVRDAAFEPDVLEAGNNSAPVELGSDHVVVVRRIDRKPAAVKPLESVREQIAEQLAKRAARDEIRRIGEGLLERARGGDELDLLARELGVEMKEMTKVLRADSKADDPRLIGRVFSIGRPVDGKRQVDGLTLGNGAYAVFELTDVIDGDPAKLTEAERRSELLALVRSVGEVEFSDVMGGLRERADIEVSKTGESAPQ